MNSYRYAAKVLLLGALFCALGARAGTKVESAQSRRNSLTLIEPLSQDEAENSRVRIASVGVILQSEKNPAQIIKLRLNRAKMYIQISRHERTTNRTNGHAKAALNLEAANGDLKAIAGLKELDNEQSGYLNYLRGLVALDSGEYDEGIAFLNKAMLNHPKGNYAIGISIFLGDEAYSAGKFDEASTDYSRYLNEMPPVDRFRSKYRLAMIKAKRSNFQDAEKIFLQLNGKKSDRLVEMRKEMLTELAELEVKFRSDKELVEFCRKTLKLSPEEETVFLHDVMVAAKGDGKQMSPVFLGRISGLTKNTTEKIRIRIQVIRLQRSKSASGENDDGLEALIADIKALPPADKKSVFDELGNELQVEVERTIEQLEGKFSRAAKGGAVNKSIERLGTQLESDLAFLQDNFHSKNRVKAMKLWLDVCASMRQWTCVLEKTKVILDDREFESLRPSALRERISAYEELTKLNSSKYAEELWQALQQYIEDDKRPDWIEFAKRLSVIDIAQKDFVGAQAILLAIDNHEKSEESYYRLQLNRFAQGLYAEVIQDKRQKAGFQSKRVTDLQRESNLRLAQADAGPGGDFAAYELHFKEYLKQVTDPLKRSQLLKDYYGRLEQNRDDAKLYAQISQLPLASRFDKDLDSLTRRLLTRFFLVGKYSEVETLLGPTLLSAPPDLVFTAVLARLANRESLSPDDLNRLNRTNKTYVLGIYALAAVPRMEAYLRATRKPAKEIRDIGFLAFKIKSCDSIASPPREMLTLLGDSVSQDLLKRPVTALEKEMQKVIFSKAKKLTPGATAKMTKSLEQVRKIRQRIAVELPQQPPVVRLRVLKQAATIESEAAETINGAPLPEGLNGSQKTEYQDQIHQMAQEFSLQANQFQQAYEKVNAELSAQNSTLPVKKLLDSTVWQWPTSDTLMNLKRRDDTAKLMTALIDLDYQRLINKNSDEDYWAMRAGFMLSKVPCDSMVKYVYQELMANGQNKIIQQWSLL